MSKGYQNNRDRREAVAELGRTLVRRSRSKCELCSAAGKPLSVVEVEPLSETPDPERSVFLCDRCNESVSGGKLDPANWRFLETLVWSEIPAVQVMAVRLCRRLDEAGIDWAGNILSGLYLSPEVEDWVLLDEK